MVPLRRHLLSLLALALFASMALASAPPTPMTPYNPTAVMVDVDPDKLYAGAVRVFLRKGWGFLQRDEHARALESNWIRPDAIGLTSAQPELRLAIRVIISKGRIEVFTGCAKMLENTIRTEDACPGGQRPAGINQQEDLIVKEIIDESGRL